MTLTEQQVEEMEMVAKPLMDWVDKNCHPHVHVLLDGQDAVLVEGIAAIRPNFEDRKRPSKF